MAVDSQVEVAEFMHRGAIKKGGGKNAQDDDQSSGHENVSSDRSLQVHEGSSNDEEIKQHEVSNQNSQQKKQKKGFFGKIASGVGSMFKTNNNNSGGGSKKQSSKHQEGNTGEVQVLSNNENPLLQHQGSMEEGKNSLSQKEKTTS